MARTLAIVIAGAVLLIAATAMTTTRKSNELFFDAPVNAPAQAASLPIAAG